MIKLVEVVNIPLKDEFEVIDGINLGNKEITNGFAKSYGCIDFILNSSKNLQENNLCIRRLEKYNFDYHITYIKDYQLNLLNDNFAKITLDINYNIYDEIKMKKGIADKMLVLINDFFYYSKAKKLAGRYFDEALIEVSEGDTFLLKKDPYKDDVTAFIVLRKDEKLYIEQVITSKKFFFV